jgi:hypothetical protein
MKTTKPLVIEACISNRLIAGVLREVRDTVEAVTGSPAVVEGANVGTSLERCSDAVPRIGRAQLRNRDLCGLAFGNLATQS